MSISHWYDFYVKIGYKKPYKSMTWCYKKLYFIPMLNLKRIVKELPDLVPCTDSG
jgi:hypothetical protein